MALRLFVRAYGLESSAISREIVLCHSLLSTSYGEPFEGPRHILPQQVPTIVASQQLRFDNEASLPIPSYCLSSARGPSPGNGSGRFLGSDLHRYNQTRELHIFRLLTGQPDRPSRKPGPDAGDCDEAHDNLTALRQRLDAIQKPSTLRSWSEVAVDTGKSIMLLAMATGRFCVAIPGWVRDFYNMPKEDWVAWKAGAWKTVKHEAHHYWVGTKLLGLDIKIASRLAIKAARGVELSRYVGSKREG